MVGAGIEGDRPAGDQQRAGLEQVSSRAGRLGVTAEAPLGDPNYLYALVRGGYLPLPATRPRR